MVAWNADGSLKSQAFDATGARQGSEFTVAYRSYDLPLSSNDDYLSSSGVGFAVTDVSGPGYAIAWGAERRSYAADRTFGVQSEKLFTQLLDDASVPRASVQSVDSLSDLIPYSYIQIVGLTNGGYLVSYVNTTDFYHSISQREYRLFDATGAATTTPTLTPLRSDASAAALPGGGFALAGVPVPPLPRREQLSA